MKKKGDIVPEWMRNNDMEFRGIPEHEFERITYYLSNKYGLRIPPEKKTMIESRLIKRLKKLEISSFSEYIKYVFNNNGSEEYKYFIDLVTTHKTFFFREEYQFEFIKSMLPEYHEKVVNRRPVNIWSAGCSTGEEVFTLGMVLNEYKKENAQFNFKITGTDISRPALEQAASGVFSINELANLPRELLKEYFRMVNVGGVEKLEFKNMDVMSKINLGVLNLNSPVYKVKGDFDFIFCRNVIIYFDFETQKKVLKKLIDRLKPGGYLFLGHSETAFGYSLPLKSIRPTIYQKI